MEAAANVKIWNRSEKYRNVCCTEFLGHGDSKAYLRSLSRKKLSDSKTIYGRLRDKTIDQFQRYYGTAIRSNANNLENMKKAIWATYFHKFSTDEKPVHHLSPGPDTWYTYRKAEQTGDFHSHEHAIPEAVMGVMKPIYRDLAHPDLLSKCLHE
ncbi:hypothetical protein PR048_008374 [Dryococelus australis]|uniref:Uncharacterized protein n=1 Tax=Dryococelus australis TaxID=614101 RepID=A0ABQ9HXT9_9NEOP|nr:hypothetical protein PR048_008374 [Dryococelus australis]